MNVELLLEKKGYQVWHVSPDETVFNAIKLMNDKGVGALAVIHEGTKLVGIISERDYAGKVILQGKSSKQTSVKEIMSSQIVHTVPERDITDCLVIMNKHRIRHLPVVKDDRLAGMISMGDVVKEIIEHQKYTIKQLENYISWEESY